ncbi:DEAD/DEAH box helicase [Nocardioides mangrovi]|uniref:DEAD/DEAH box helicase n=1 Tax=Nocardioides mangrovi TaxID=2874580 RepID=A0ABS7U6I7_9ACTN|nr:DEAD/DEAH box helicase [Nocardioides mangrovi]MBZ5736599.1 DEAD/DEAH box helicase [Nocardioides mangrovi]
MSILAALTLDALAPFFDPGALLRGRDYARDGRIIDPELTKITDDTVIATGHAIGSSGRHYSVHLYAELVGDAFWATSTCSCPVQVDCKHGVALARTIASPAPHAPTGPAAWEQQVGKLMTELTSRDQQASWQGDPVPLALEVALEARHHYYRGAESVLTLRPMRLGAKGRWVKTGADWTNLGGPVAQRGFRTAEVDAVLDLRSALMSSDPGWRHTGPVELHAFGRRLVTLLARAREVGLPLLAGAGLESVELLDAAVPIACDVTRDDAGTTVVGVGVDHDGRWWRGPGVFPIGGTAYAVGLLREGRLVLAPTSAPVPAAVADLLDTGTDIRVPLTHHEQAHDVLARLARTVDLRSTDGSVQLPEPVRPTLRLTVRWSSSTQAALTWTWHYAEQQCALDSRDALAGLRDRDAEREIRGRVPADLLQRASVRDGDALAFAIHDLPAVRDLEDVEVVEEAAPVFRESTADPSISLEVADDQPSDTTDWLDLAVTVTVEGEKVPLPDVLATLTRGDEHLVLPSGLYLRTDHPQLERLREVVAAAAELREAEGDRMSVGKHDLGVWRELGDLGIVDAQAAEWVSRARALADLAELPRPEPVGLATELRSYQRDGFHWLAFLWQHRLGGILADDMGLGKTLQVLALIQHAVATDDAGPFLVVAPTSVVSAWASEAARHTPGLRVARVTRRADDVAAAAHDADIVVTTYALLRLEQEAFAGVGWAGLVLDEAQQLKNHRSQTYAAARKVDAPFRLAVTGTPFENRLMELWSLLSITVPGIYPWPRSFTSQVVTPVEKNGDQAALDRFRRRIRPFLLRRTKELVAEDLPPKQEQLLEVELNPRHRKLYDAHLAKERQRILGLLEDFEQNRVEIFSALTTLRRAALDAALLEPAHDRVGSAKLDVLVDHLAEITAEGHQALVFSQFTSYLTRVEAGLGEAGIDTTYLDGSTTDRDAAIARFRSGSAPVFLISLKAGGVGLTLTEADYVFVLDPWWNPAVEAQAVDRAHRIGQTRPVHVYRMIATDTIEEKVVALKDRKAELFARVVDGEGASATGLTAADVRALFE